MHGVPPGSPPLATPLRLSVYAEAGAGAPVIERLLAAACERRVLILAPAVGNGAQTSEPALQPPGNIIAIIVVDAAEGLTPAARRHAAIARAAGARHIVLALDGSEPAPGDRAHQSIAQEFGLLAAGLEFASSFAIPVSSSSAETLLAHLDRVAADADDPRRPLRLLIEQSQHRGTILSGSLQLSQEVKEALSEASGSVGRILVNGAERERAAASEAVTIEIAGDVTTEPGDMLVEPGRPPFVAEQFAARLVWLGEEPLLPGRDYLLKMNGREVGATVTAIKHRLDTDTLRHEPARTLERGEVGAATIATAAPLALDAFAELPQTARFSLCDRFGHALVAAGTVDFVLRRGVNVHMQPLVVSKTRRAALKAQGPCILWFTGLSGAGKSTIANLVEGQLAQRGSHTYLLDGDNVRHGLNKNLGFTAADRVENIRRVGEVAKLFVDAGLIVLCSFISPFRAEREAVRDLVEPGEFVEIFVRAPLDVCERRDPKGLYAKSRAGALPNFTGIDSPYEEPESPDLVLDTTSAPAPELARRVIALLEARRMIAAAGPKSF